MYKEMFFFVFETAFFNDANYGHAHQSSIYFVLCAKSVCLLLYDIEIMPSNNRYVC